MVAHGISVMVVQAQGAAAALRRHPERTADALTYVIDTGRTSLAEMRAIDRRTRWARQRATRDRLLAAVRVVAAGQAVAAPTVTRRLIEHFTSATQHPHPTPPGWVP